VQAFLRHKDKIEVILHRIAPSFTEFTDTHVTQEVQDHELYISGYACVRGNSETSKTGGVFLYIKEKIKYIIVSVESCDRNWWAITIRLAEISLNVSIMLIYHSPSGSNAAFVEYLEKSCDRALMSDSFIVMGDFNIDMKVQGYTQDKLRRTLNSVGLSQLVKKATRITSKYETMIDLVFSNMDLQIEVSHEPKIADHSMVVLNWNIKEAKGENQRKLYRD